MYQPYPTSGQGPPPQRPEPPRPVRTAVKLMYTGAALSAVGVVLELVAIGSVRSAIKKADPSLTSAQIHNAEVFGVAFAVIIGLIGIGLWVWMAWANGRGKSWARVVASVLFGLNTVFLLLAFARPHVGIGLILDLLVWLCGLGTIIMIWNKESSGYYQAMSQPRY